MKVGRLLDGGTLQMLKVKGVDNAHLEAEQVTGATYDVEWVDIPEPDIEYDYTPGETAPTDEQHGAGPRRQPGARAGRGRLLPARGPGLRQRGVVYFTSTQGGGDAEARPRRPSAGYGNGSGQVWAYDIKRRKLTCLFQSPGPLVLDFPDNVTTSKRGHARGLRGHTADNFIRGLTRKGELFDIALNRLVSSTADATAPTTSSRARRSARTGTRCS